MENTNPNKPKNYLWIVIAGGLLVVLLLGLFAWFRQTATPSATTRDKSTTTNSAEGQKDNHTTVLSLTYAVDPEVTFRPGDPAALDVMIDPGQNFVHYLKMDILYDSTKLRLDNSYRFTKEAANMTVTEGPTYTPGKISITLSTGSDPENAVRKPTKVGTILFRAVASTPIDVPTIVSIGANAEARSLAPSDNESENIISSILPAEIIIE